MTESARNPNYFRNMISRVWPRLVLTALLGVFLSTLPAVSQEDSSADPSVVSIKVGEGRFIRLPEPAKAVFLSNPEVAEIDLQSASYIYIVGRGLGTTNLYVLGENDRTLIEGTIHVDIYLDRIQTAVSHAVQGGAIRLSTMDGAVFLNGTVDTDVDAETAEEVVSKLAGDAAVVINNLKLATPAQVNLQVTIAEVSRQVQEDLGISLNASSGSGNRSFTAPSGGGEGFQVSLNYNGGNLNIALDALARSGLATILSEPNLTARSGEKASFLAGGRVPVRVGATQDDTRVDFETIGVELDFTPTVYKKDQIQIQLDTRVRQIDGTNSTEGAPAFSERSASTTIELGSGQSFAIAGMFSSNQVQSLDELPGIAKIPIIGALFRSSAYRRGETELVIIVTPYIVNPTDRSQLKTPLDDVSPAANGVSQFGTGRMSSPPKKVDRLRGKSGATFMITR